MIVPEGANGSSNSHGTSKFSSARWRHCAVRNGFELSTCSDELHELIDNVECCVAWRLRDLREGAHPILRLPFLNPKTLTDREVEIRSPALSGGICASMIAATRLAFVCKNKNIVARLSRNLVNRIDGTTLWQHR